MYIKFITLKEVPLLRITIILILGVIIGYSFPSILIHLLACVAIISLCIINLALRNKVKANKLLQFQTVSSISLFFAILFSGYCLGFSAQENLHHQHYSIASMDSRDSSYTIKILSPLEAKSKSFKFKGEILSTNTSSQTTTFKGTILCYIAMDSLSVLLGPNDIILTTAKIKAISGPKNPNEMDYRQYLANNQIHGSCYIAKNKWINTNSSEASSFTTPIANLRNYFQEHIIKHIKGAREQQIALAILIGVKSDLDKETRNMYANSGAMHILAVSGLHVGIVYMLFNSILFFLQSKRWPWLRPLIIILLIWLYALISGASPSVLRASTMFSFIALGQAFQRHINIYNMLAASALVLIIINPLIIKALGFQLSYAAVFGIIFFHRKIYALYTPSNFLIDKIWSLTAVSIAAQLTTLPLSLLYFHQFPNLSLLANILVIPAAIVIVYTGVALLILSFSSFLSSITGCLLEKIIYYLNEFIGFIASLPFSTTTDIHFTGLACILMYLSIVSFSIAIANRFKSMLIVSFLSILVLILSFALPKYTASTENHILVYNIPNAAAIEIKNGTTVTTFQDSALTLDQQKQSFHIKPQQTSYGNAAFIQKIKRKDYNLLQIEDHSILLIDQAFKLPQKSITVDYAIISRQNRLYLKEFATKIKSKKYIFDSSNNPNQYYYWKKDCESLNLDCYFVSDSFAFEEKLL